MPSFEPDPSTSELENISKHSKLIYHANFVFSVEFWVELYKSIPLRRCFELKKVDPEITDQEPDMVEFHCEFLAIPASIESYSKLTKKRLEKHIFDPSLSKFESVEHVKAIGEILDEQMVQDERIRKRLDKVRSQVVDVETHKAKVVTDIKNLKDSIGNLRQESERKASLSELGVIFDLLKDTEKGRQVLLQKISFLIRWNQPKDCPRKKNLRNFHQTL